jgi:hypothetical protein
MSISRLIMQIVRLLSMICCKPNKFVASKTPALVAGVFFFLMLAGCSPQERATVAGGIRWQPAAADTVVFTFDEGSGETASLYELRLEMSAKGADPVLAAEFATAALRNYARSGDPRMLGYAAGALLNWQEAARPPLAIWLLRGRLTQTEHHFETAALDMDRLLTEYPRNAEALLLAADAWRRAGNLSAARGRCLQLSLAGFGDLARLCAADIQLALGQPALALKAAAAAIQQGKSRLQDETLAWAHAVHAEAAIASGDSATALASWASALAATSQPALALRLGYVDALLAARQFNEALAELSVMPEADAVLLRRAIAADATGAKSLATLRRELQERFADVAYTANDSLHWRERALFELDVMKEPATALQYAQRNWALQKGFEDAELLLRAAAAVGDQEAAQAVYQWRREQGGTS